MIRLIATDMDDTLLDASSRLTGRTLSALQQAISAGAMLSLSSGRMPESMLPFAETIGVNAPMILFNGALIYDHRTDEILYSNPIPAETALAVAKMIEAEGIYLQIYPGKGYYCHQRCEHTDRYEASIRVPCTELGMPVSQWMTGGMIKMLAIATPEVIDALQAKLRAAFPSGVNFMKSKAHYLEIVAEGVDKGSAIRVLAEKLHLSADEIMAFGDGQNDATMLEAARLGVAMENAVSECKAVAKLIAPRNTEDGVAQVIEQFLAEGKFTKE